MHLNNVIVVLVSLIALLVVGGRATVTNVLIVSPSLSKSIVHATGRIADILAERHNVVRNFLIFINTFLPIFFRYPGIGDTSLTEELIHRPVFW